MNKNGVKIKYSNVRLNLRDIFPADFEDERLKRLLKRAVNREKAPESLRVSVRQMIRE
jgi:hypothetical protein